MPTFVMSPCRTGHSHQGRFGGSRSRGFTLVELLVVIGIIALLISILLPSLGKARQAATRTACLANTKQIMFAFNLYANANKDYLPFSAPNNLSRNEDWVWWQNSATRIANLGDGGIGPYLDLKPTNYKVLVCPADDVSYRVRVPTGGKYPFSYSINGYMSSNATVPQVNNLIYKFGRIIRPTEKVFLFEEDERTIDDGYGTIYTAPASGGANLLAIRHDSNKRKASDLPTTANPVPNSDGKGCVGFCDGHSDFVARSYAHSKKHTVPDEEGPGWSGLVDLFPNSP